MKTTTAKKPRPTKKAQKKVADPTRELARAAAQACHDHKGEEILVLDIAKLSSFADYFVIVSGSSDRQVRALADAVEEGLSKQAERPQSIEGYDQGRWILLDYGSVVAHIFQKEVRPHYALEEFWHKARQVKFSLK